MNKPVGRRAFLKFMSAAPVAAPAAAKASVLELEKQFGMGDMPSAGYVGYPVATQADTVSYLQQELKDLLCRRKEATSRERDSNGYENDLAGDLRIDGMRSVSPVNRARLIAEQRSRRQRARDLSNIDRNIAKIKERLGPLGELL